MHRFGKGKNVASVLKYHGKMWYNFAVPYFAVLNFAPANPPPPPGSVEAPMAQGICLEPTPQGTPLPCPSYSGRKDCVNLGPTFLLQPHKTRVWG